MSFFVKYLRKIVVLLIGAPIFILGVVLIPLPGPGLLICFAGLFILSLEFDWVKPHLERSKTEVRKIVTKAKARQDNFKQSAGKEDSTNQR